MDATNVEQPVPSLSMESLGDLKRRNAQLQAAAMVALAANTILDLVRLVDQVVDLVREHFKFYYVGLFLVDETLRAGPMGQSQGKNGADGADGDARRRARWAVLRAGAGAGAEVGFLG